MLSYTATIGGQTKTTIYTYDAANRLLTATQEGITWHYTYDGNGSLAQTNPGENVANGAKRYRYNTAGYLVKVETYTDHWQVQAEMAYDGLGNRLSMTGYADGQSVITQYTLDNGQVLASQAGEDVTFYLYGQGLIGQQQGQGWAYALPDGTNTARQMVDGSGEVTLAASYTPWGDSLSVSRAGSFPSGYFGAKFDSATGLLYIGNGQYYDPQTGRFLNRDVNSNQVNSSDPLRSDLSGTMIAPLALLVLAYGKKKKQRKIDQIIILLVLGVAVSISLVACMPVTTTPLPQPSQSKSPTPKSSSTPSPIPNSENGVIPQPTVVSFQGGLRS